LRIDPVYLRQILTGLGDGTVTPDISSLPFGVESVFERWVSEWPGEAGHPIDILRAYALLKDPLGMADMAFLLDLETDDIHAAIRDNAHLFNRTSATGHVLFHDRFRTHILAGSSSHELKDILNRLHAKLEGALRLPGISSIAIREYAFQHLWSHAICSDANPEDLLTMLLKDTVIHSFETDTQDGWLKIRNHFHQLRIRQRYAEPHTILDLCIAELSISQKYSGQDVLLENGSNSLKLDNLHDYPSLAALALVNLKQGKKDKSKQRFQQCKSQFRAQWGTSATLTDGAGQEASYDYTRSLLKHLVANAASQNEHEFVFEVLQFMDQYSWASACRAAMRAACTAKHHDLGAALLKWLTQFDWHPEEEHPLEIAGQLGADAIVMGADHLFEDRWFRESALQKLSIHHLSNHRPKSANPPFQKLVASIKSPDGFREVDQPLRLILLASVLAHTSGFTSALDSVLQKIESAYRNTNVSARENLTRNITSELGHLPRTAAWTSELLSTIGTPSHSIEQESKPNHAEETLMRCFPNLLSSVADATCPVDWPQRMLCREQPDSSTAMRVGLALECQFRENDNLSTILELPAA
jgi:hypothetical protein